MDATNHNPEEMPEVPNTKTEIMTLCNECGEPSAKVCEVREPDGAIYLLCDLCLEAVEDTVDILNERKA